MTEDMNQVEQSNQTQPQDGMDIVMPPEPAEDPQTTHERAAFMRHVQEQGEAIPSNFKSAEDWFNSLKEAQSQYTKSRQEIAELKKVYSETGVQNPAYDPKAEEQPQQEAPKEEKPDVSDMPDELVITKPEEPPTPEGVSQEDWAKWGQEIDKHGNLTEATRQEIATRLKADPVVVDQLVRGRLAMKEQSFNMSAQVVGGADNLKHILKCAGENLPQTEIDAMNRAMQTDAYQSVLLGLQARYQQSVPQPTEASPEPQVSTQNAVPSGQTRNPAANAVQAFASELEMKAAINDPRYRTDPAFRQAVEQRIIVSHQNGYRHR